MLFRSDLSGWGWLLGPHSMMEIEAGTESHSDKTRPAIRSLKTCKLQPYADSTISFIFQVLKKYHAPPPVCQRRCGRMPLQPAAGAAAGDDDGVDEVGGHLQPLGEHLGGGGVLVAGGHQAGRRAGVEVGQRLAEAGSQADLGENLK